MPSPTNARPAFIDDDGKLEEADLEDDFAPPGKPPPLAPKPPIAPLPDGSRRGRRAARAIEAVESKKSPKPREKGEPKKNYNLIAIVSSLRSLIIVFAVAVIVGTIFTSFTSNASLSPEALSSLAIVQVTEAHNGPVPTDLPTPVWFKRIGIVPGHSGIAKYGRTKGNVDPGAVCKSDGFTEASVTMKVAQAVIAALRGRGYTVDQLDEWDDRLDALNPYDASLFLSIHADSCDNFNDGFPHSGFKAAGPEARKTVHDQDARLVDCIRNYYGQATGLAWSGYSITINMTDYHAFHQITQRTPAAIIELGLLYYDRDTLEHHPDKSAAGIINGLLCFLDPKSLATQTPAPTLIAPNTAILTPNKTLTH